MPGWQLKDLLQMISVGMMLYLGTLWTSFRLGCMATNHSGGCSNHSTSSLRKSSRQEAALEQQLSQQIQSCSPQSAGAEVQTGQARPRFPAGFSGEGYPFRGRTVNKHQQEDNHFRVPSSETHAFPCGKRDVCVFFATEGREYPGSVPPLQI